MATVDSRIANLEWRVTEGITAVLPITFRDANGDILPVDTWTFAARVLPRPGAVGSPTALAVDTTQASVGQITITVDNSVSDGLNPGDYTWSLIWTVAGEPTGGVGGRFTVEAEGARGAMGVVVTS